MLDTAVHHHDPLPDYVVINSIPSSEKAHVLRASAKIFTFPLSDKESKVIQILAAKYDQEKNMAGLAAPQIGFSYQAIIFAVPDDPELKKWRTDLEQIMQKTIWLNPSYEAVGTEKTKDFEACFSVKDLAGEVDRYKTIKYHAYNLNGQVVEGIASGFLARVIQHEIDHLQGKLFIDYVSPENLMTIEAYRQLRAQKMEET